MCMIYINLNKVFECLMKLFSQWVYHIIRVATNFPYCWPEILIQLVLFFLQDYERMNVADALIPKNYASGDVIGKIYAV